ncbi:hypothetical protein [Actinophytocola sp. NPDC049390]|uniref:hypothetical protein n=1 Tax=Actinophytocola sp. NPDC049390 TaxID=3363894 RepID=UPI0037BDE156
MALSERLSAPPAGPQRPCGVRRILTRLTDADRAAFVAALDDDRWTTTALLAELQAEGHEVSHTTVLRHRKGLCSCGPR